MKRWLPLIIFGFIAIGFFIHLNREPTQHTPQKINIPSFKLEKQSDIIQGFSDKDLPNKLCLIHFFKPHCAPCQLELAVIKKLSNTYHLPVFAIAYESSGLLDLENWVSKTDGLYKAIGLDRTGSVIIDWGIKTVPSLALISAKKNNILLHEGALTPMDVTEKFTPLLKKVLLDG